MVKCVSDHNTERIVDFQSLVVKQVPGATAIKITRIFNNHINKNVRRYKIKFLAQRVHFTNEFHFVSPKNTELFSVWHLPLYVRDISGIQKSGLERSEKL